MADHQIYADSMKPTKHRMIIVWILQLTLIIAYLDRVNVAVLIADKTFLTDMGIVGNPVKMGMLMTVFLISYGISNLLLAPLGDYLGPRRAMIISIALWGISLAFGGFATSFAIMLAARIMLGIGEGMHWPMQSKFVKNWFPPEERGKANAIYLIGLKIGPALAMPFFAWVVQTSGWRSCFLIMSVSSLIPMLLLWFYTTDHPEQCKFSNRAEIEYIKNGLKKEAEKEAGLAKASVWDNILSFIKNYRYWLLTIYYGCHASIFWGIMMWLPSYLINVRGFTWSEMGTWSSISYILATVSVLVVGYLSDKIGRRAPFNVLSMVCAAGGIYFGAYADDNFIAVTLIILANGALGLGMPTFWAIMQTIVPARAIGTGSGIVNGVANGGSALSPILIGYFIGITGSYVGGLIFLVALGLVAALCALILSIQKY